MTVIHPPRNPLFDAAMYIKYGVLLLETETVFGLAAIPEKINDLFKIKSRNETKAISWVFPPEPTFVDARRTNRHKTFDDCWVCKSPFHRELVNYFFHIKDPLTVVVPGDPKIKECASPGSSKMGIGIRFGNFGLNQLAHLVGPYLLTSANISGEKSPKMIEEIDLEILSKVVGFYNLEDFFIENEDNEHPGDFEDYFIKGLNKYHRVLKGEPSPVIYLNGSTIEIIRGNLSKGFSKKLYKEFPRLEVK